MSSFPPWLDPATLAWCAEYCEAMAKRLPPVEAAVAADVCGKGLRQAIENSRLQPPPARPQPRLIVIGPSGAQIECSQARMEMLFGRDWLEGKE